jgi:hypothetical protein
MKVCTLQREKRQTIAGEDTMRRYQHHSERNNYRGSVNAASEIPGLSLGMQVSNSPHWRANSTANTTPV